MRRGAVASHLAVVGVAFSIFAFARPLADDFCRANVDQGILYLWQTYLNWSGRWLGQGVEILLLSLWDPTISYPLIAGSLALFHLLCVFVFIRSFLGENAKPNTVISVGGAYFVLFWAMHPSPADSFYWFTGSAEYQVNLALVLLLWALMWRAEPASSLGRFSTPAAAGILAFLIAGFHELLGSMLAAALITGAVLTHKTDHPNRSLWAWVAVFSILGLLVVGLAPGNQVRATQFPDNYDLLRTLWLSVYQAAVAVTLWICNLKLLAATILFVLHPAVRALRPSWLDRERAVYLWLTPGLWGLLLVIGFGLPTWLMGATMPGRTLSTVYYVFLLGWFANVFVFTRRLDVSAVVSKPYLPVIRSSVLLFYSLSILFTGNSRVAIRDLLEGAGPWRDAMDARYSLIRDSQGQQPAEVRVPPLPDRPRIFGPEPGDIKADPNHWSNECVADFFGVPSIRLEDEVARP